MNQAFILLGTNIDREENYVRALERIARLGRIARGSTVYVTAPVGGQGDDFLNGSILLETALPAQALKRELCAIEERMGRVRTGDPNAPRTIDLDLVLFNQETIDDGEVRVPDPLIFRRPFLAQTLAEIAPDYRPPSSAETLAQIAERLNPDAATMRPDPAATRRANTRIGQLQIGETTHA